MPPSSEQSLNVFRQLKQEIEGYDLARLTEADTRARIITRLLHEVLGWPHENVSREENANPGFMDYVLHTNKRTAVIEAKKSGDTFKLPADITSSRAFTLNGIIRKVKNLNTYIDQVSRYCFQNGIEYAIVTNGTQFIAFRAVRIDGIHIGQGHVIVFNGFEDIESRFIEFWNLLSKIEVENNSLVRAFQLKTTSIFEYKRAVDHVHSYRELVTRNDLSLSLEPLLSEYMGEIVSQKTRLKDLYVKSRALADVLNAVKRRINLHLSKTLKTTGAVIEHRDHEHVRRNLKTKIASHLSIPARGEVILLLGRVGSGKTTFVNHFLRIELQETFENHILIPLDFLDMEKGGIVHKFFYTALQEALSKNKVFTALSAKQLRQVYAPEIRELSVGPLAVLEKTNKKAFEQEIARFLLAKYEDVETHYPRVLKFLADRLKTRCIFVFDNADQHDFDFQQEIFTFAYSITNKCHGFSIVPMWEETYLRSKQQRGALSTYRSTAYNLPPTSVVEIIDRRLGFIISELKKETSVARLLVGDEARLEDVVDFIRLIRNSIFGAKKRVRFFLESVAMGHLRKAMDLFSMFMVSGHTDASKILFTFRTSKSYLVPVHEFIKSIGLGDSKYYHGDLSYVVNLYTLSDESRPSHFTKLRLLHYLSYHRHHSSSPGLGFISRDVLFRELERIGTSRTDFEDSARLLIQHSLIENDIYDLTRPGNSYRVTPAGRYYLRYLAVRFPYLDLVLQDTPISDRNVYDTVSSLVNHRDLQDRILRVDSFLGYLLQEEERENAAIVNTSDSIPLRLKIVASLLSEYQEEKEYMVKRAIQRKEQPVKTPYRPK